MVDVLQGRLAPARAIALTTQLLAALGAILRPLVGIEAEFETTDVETDVERLVEIRWLVEHLRPGDYRVRIPSTELDPGGTLEGMVPSTGAASDPDADVDEIEEQLESLLVDLDSYLATVQEQQR